MNSFTIGMIGRVMVIVGVLIPMLVFNDPKQTSPINILFWVITIVGFGLWIYGRTVQRKELQNSISKKQKNKDEVKVEL